MLEQTLRVPVGLVGTNRNLVGQRELPAHRTTLESYELQQLLRTMADAGCAYAGCAYAGCAYAGCAYAMMEVSFHALVQHRAAGLTFDAGPRPA